MNPANPPAILMGAPELLHVATALAALDALDRPGCSGRGRAG